MTSDWPTLDRARETPLSGQIAEFYRDLLKSGRMVIGERLPTIRELSERLAVTRATVQEAYRRLGDEGLVEATVGRGTVALAGATPDPGRQGGAFVTREPDEVLSSAALAAWQHLQTAPTAPRPSADVRPIADFAQLLPDEGRFPVARFTESIERVLRTRGRELLGYGQPMGDLQLRQLLANRQQMPDGASPEVRPDQVLITNGAQQGIDLVLRTFAQPGDAVAVAVPTYHHLFGLLRSHGLDLVPIRASEDGLDLDDVQRVAKDPRVRMLYVMPTFHNPTGRTLGLSQRRQLISVLESTRLPILEDEFEHELRFAGDAMPSLRSLDPRGLTVTVGTFSKGLFPGVRTGWVYASDAVLGPMAALKRYTDLESSALLQAALADFVEAGGFDEYLASLRAELKERHRVAQTVLAETMPAGSSWSRPDGGFALWVEGPSGADADRVASDAAERGVLVTPGRVFYPDAKPRAGMRLSLSRTDADRVERGIRILADCFQSNPAAHQAPQHRLLL